MVNKRPEKTGKSFENNIEAQLVNQGYKKVKAKILTNYHTNLLTRYMLHSSF